MLRTVALLGCALILSACASGVQKMRKINPGMSPEQVLEIMDERDSFSTVEKNGSIYTLFKYTNQFCNAHVNLYEKCDFFVIFKDGKVIETGVSNVRSAAPNMQFLYMFNLR
jgi:hypothetical protein